MLYFETGPHLVVYNRHHFLLGQAQKPHSINPGLGEVVDEIGALIDLRIIKKVRMSQSVSQYPVLTSRNEVTFWTVQVEGSRLWSRDLDAPEVKD